MYEANVTTAYVKLATFGFGKTLYRLTFTFRADDGATKVTALGQALERTRDAFGEWLAGATRFLTGTVRGRRGSPASSSRTPRR